MPRYHFHLVDGQVTDIKGIELAGEAAARRYAQNLAQSFGSEYRAVRVVSEGHELFRVNMSDQDSKQSDH